jgi:hypothetical protein
MVLSHWRVFAHFSRPAVDVSNEVEVVNLSQITVQALRSEVRWHASTHHSKEEVALMPRSCVAAQAGPRQLDGAQLLASTHVDAGAEQISAAEK